MKHAGEQALDRLDDLLAKLRALPGLVEKKRGTFYRKSRAFVHFHEDPAGLFADIRDAADADFERIEVTHEDGRAKLLELARHRLHLLSPPGGERVG